MQRERSKPSYDLSEAKWLARCGMLSISGRTRRFIKNRYGNRAQNIVKEIFESLRPDDFRKTIALDSLPGIWADVYVTECRQTTWYLKYFISEDFQPELHVLSANWDGYIH